MSTRREQLEAMLAREPNDAFLRFALAMEHAKAGRLDDAVEQFNLVLAADRGYISAWFQMGHLLEQAGRFDDAKATYRRGIEAAAAKGDAHAADRMKQALESLVRTTGES